MRNEDNQEEFFDKVLNWVFVAGFALAVVMFGCAVVVMIAKTAELFN